MRTIRIRPDLEVRAREQSDDFGIPLEFARESVRHTSPGPHRLIQTDLVDLIKALHVHMAKHNLIRMEIGPDGIDVERKVVFQEKIFLE